MTYWKADYAAKKCAVCHKEFTFTKRQHHCRCCGELVCGDCSPNKISGIPVLEGTPEGKVYDAGTEVRVCDFCTVDPRTLYIDEEHLFYNSPKEIRGLVAYGKRVLLDFLIFFPFSSSKMGALDQYQKRLRGNDLWKREHKRNAEGLLREDNPVKWCPQRTVDYWEKSFKYCERVGIANCRELSQFMTLAFFYYREKHIEVLFDGATFSLIDEDHALFILSLNTKKQKDISRSDLGIDAVVFDPWKKSIFLLDNYRKYYGRDARLRVNGGLPDFVWELY